MADKIDYIVISVPEMNDSISRMTFDNIVYNLRLTYNDTGDFWTLGFYNSNVEPIIQGIKIVPNTSLTLPYLTYDIPLGAFMAYSKKSHIGRYDFKNGEAQLIFIPL